MAKDYRFLVTLAAHVSPYPRWMWRIEGNPPAGAACRGPGQLPSARPNHKPQRHHEDRKCGERDQLSGLFKGQSTVSKPMDIDGRSLSVAGGRDVAAVT
jgi:hypothetical protein